MVKKNLFISLALFGLLLSTMPRECFADASAQLQQADAYMKDRNYEQAEEIYQQIVTDFPDSNDALEAQKQLTILYIKQDNQPQADVALQKLLTNFSEHKQIAKAVNKVADHYRWSRKYELARQLYQYVVDNWPDDEYAIWSQKSLATSNIQLGDDPNAAAAIEKLLTNFSEHKQIAKAVYMVAHRYSMLKRYEKARRLYQYVVDNWPDDDYAMWSQKGLAASNIQLGDDPNAAAAIEKLLTNFSEHKQIAKAVNEVADKYTILKRYEKARRLYQHVVDNWPDAEYAIWAQRDVAISSIKLIDDDDTAAAVEKLLANFSEHKQIAEAVNKVADHYRWSRQYEEARQLYQYVVNNWPDDEYAIWSQKSLATSNIQLGDDPNAAAAIEKLLTNFSEHKQIAEAAYKVARRYRLLKRYEKASELYQYVIDHWPDDEYAMQSKMEVAKRNVWSLIESGDDPNAQAALDRLIADFNDHPDLPEAIFRAGGEYYSKARLKESEGLREQAREYFRKALTLWEKIIQELPASTTTPRAHYLTAFCYRHCCEYEKAIHHYKKIVDNWADYRYARHAKFMIGRCSKQLEKSASNCNPK